MIKLFVSQILAEVESLKDMLEQQSIPCTIKNQQGSNLAGEVPFAEVFPELWVLNNDDYPKAKGFLDDWKDSKPLESSSWMCANCGETLAKEFSTCWNCQTDRDPG